MGRKNKSESFYANSIENGLVSVSESGAYRRDILATIYSTRGKDIAQEVLKRGMPTNKKS